MNNMQETAKSYEIDFDNFLVRNDDSHGWKEIFSWTAASNETPHLVYINDDQRMWYQAVTWEEIERIEYTEAQQAAMAAVLFDEGS